MDHDRLLSLVLADVRVRGRPNDIDLHIRWGLRRAGLLSVSTAAQLSPPAEQPIVDIILAERLQAGEVPQRRGGAVALTAGPLADLAEASEKVLLEVGLLQPHDSPLGCLFAAGCALRYWNLPEEDCTARLGVLVEDAREAEAR